MKASLAGALLSLSLALGAGVVLTTSPAPGANGRTTGGNLTVTDRSVYTGESVKFTGWLVRGKVNQKALLQVWRDGTWRRVAYDYTNRRGNFSLKVDMDYAAGTFRFRVLGKRSRLYDVPQVTTRTVKVTLHARPGSQELPWRPGQAFNTDGWRFTFGVTDFDAWPERQATYSEADPPPPGWAYIAVPLTFTRTGTDSGHAWIDNSIRFVGSDGVVYSSSATVNGHDYYCWLADDWSDAPELYPGGTASGSECIVIRQTAIPGGIWRIDNYPTEQFITPN